MTRPVLERTFGNQLRVVGQVVRAPGTTVTVKAILAGRVETLHVAPARRFGPASSWSSSTPTICSRCRATCCARRSRSGWPRAGSRPAGELYEIEGVSRQELELREQAAFSARLSLAAAREELTDLGLAEETVERILAERRTDPHLPVRSPIDAVVLELEVQAARVGAGVRIPGGDR